MPIICSTHKAEKSLDLTLLIQTEMSHDRITVARYETCALIAFFSICVLSTFKNYHNIAARLYMTVYKAGGALYLLLPFFFCNSALFSVSSVSKEVGFLIMNKCECVSGRDEGEKYAVCAFTHTVCSYESLKDDG